MLYTKFSNVNIIRNAGKLSLTLMYCLGIKCMEMCLHAPFSILWRYA
jgi:hypothetical protein